MVPILKNSRNQLPQFQPQPHQ